LPSRLLDRTTLKRLTYYRRAAEALFYAWDRLPEPTRLEEVASRVGMTSAAFSRYFAEKIGLTFSQALKVLRVEDALEELEQRDCSIEHLAHISGYSDGCSFARAFKTVLGQTPSEYRRSFLSRR
jgi:two-component system response regulator YesN